MPAYLSMRMVFSNERIKPGFIKGIHQYFIDAGFEFSGGFHWTDTGHAVIDTTLDEISEHNQSVIENKLQLGFPKIDYDDYDEEYNNSYRQILFKREGYSELRGILGAGKVCTGFTLLIPEDDVKYPTGERGTFCYLKDKTAPFAKLAKKLWEDGKVDAVLTELEHDDPPYDIFDAMKGRNIRFRPFAVIPELAYKKFPEGYFEAAEITKLAKNGIYIEKSGDEDYY